MSDTFLDALLQIGNLPLEFNTRARAIAQRAVNRAGLKVKWTDPLSEEQIFKAVERGGMIRPQEEKKMEQQGTYQAPEIEMIPVESSNIESVGHDGEKTLRVKFINGHPYDYVGISEDQFLDLLNAPSVGKAYGALTRGKITGIKLAMPEVA